MRKPKFYALDLESTLTPEIWVTIAQKTGVEELKLTTRDISDYSQLMKKRIEVARTHGLTLSLIQEIIAEIEPLPGAKEFLDWLRQRAPIAILSDTFYEFAIPLIKKLEFPALFCHSLSVDSEGYIKNFHLRDKGSKKETVAAFKSIGFEVVVIGDSHNDTAMMKEGDEAFFIHAPESIAKQFPQFPSHNSYTDLQNTLIKLAPTPFL